MEEKIRKPQWLQQERVAAMPWLINEIMAVAVINEIMAVVIGSLLQPPQLVTPPQDDQLTY